MTVVTVRKEPLWRALLDPFANIFMAVLLVAAVISFFQGSSIDAAIILAIMAVSAIIYYIQKFSTERILWALHKRNRHSVIVLRGNKQSALDASTLVPGDIILVREGDKIPADARLLDVKGLKVDESQLTGESQPVEKQSAALAKGKEAYEQTNMLFQGSFVVAGEASAVVVATGNATEFGRMALLISQPDIQGPVQRKIDKLISQIIIVAAAVGVVAFTLAVLRGMDVGESLRFVIALAVSAVPEGLPVAISVILVLGMRRMAAKKALMRNMRAIETLGALTTIATDKTGTLTKNKLSVAASWQPEDSDHFAQIIHHSINRQEKDLYDPLDIALDEYARRGTITVSKHQPMASFPFDHAISMSGNLWHKGAEYELAVKGAPEVILAHSSLSENEREEATAQLHKLSSNGYRVIALARLTMKKPIRSLAKLSDRLEFVGFVGVADTLRPEARRAIQAATTAGVSVRMITGDHYETAFHIAKQLGMVLHRDEVFDSRKMTVMSDEELEKVIEHIRVFSRVTPERKYRLLSLLKKHHITAMTGDGVNDVPALTGAHVGIAMGSGAGIARDAGDMILLDDNFKSIIDAIREGRAIIANIRRMLYYLLTTSSGEVLAMVGSLLIGLPLPLLPVQILWVNLVTDTALVIPLGLEPGEASAMRQRPRKTSAPILESFIITRIALVAIIMAAVVIGTYAYYQSIHGHLYAQTIAFSTLVVMQWANAFCARSEHESVFKRLKVINGKFFWGLAVAVGLQLLVLFSPLGGLLHIVPVAITDLLITGVIGFITPVIAVELHKLLVKKR